MTDLEEAKKKVNDLCECGHKRGDHGYFGCNECLCGELHPVAELESAGITLFRYEKAKNKKA